MRRVIDLGRLAAIRTANAYRVVQRPSLPRDRRALRLAAVNHGLLAVLPLIVTAWVTHFSWHLHEFAIDFHNEYWVVGRRVLHGLSPYDLSWQNIRGGVAFPYPALDAWLFAPFALIARGDADVLFTGLNIAAVLLALRVLEVEDWRLYGVVLLWEPVISGYQTANVTLLLCLGFAVVWRLRDRPTSSGVLVALLVSLKVFVWPLGLWLLATRRYAALAWSIGLALLLNVVAWAALGLDQFRLYTHLTQAVTRFEERRSYTVVAFALWHGASRETAYGIGVALAVTLACALIAAGRRRSDETSLVLCVGLCLLATPVLWTHYFALLVVPLALRRPEFGVIWLVPLGLFAVPVVNPTEAWQLVGAIGAVTLMLVVLLRARPQWRFG